jgi:phospholipid/cholesterol/gamma-HCH transport system substrate-binding protein
MEKTAHYFIVGLFVMVSIFAFIGFLIWLMGARDRQNYDFYTVVFKDSISGLEEGSNVHYKGVQVGRVMKLRLVPDNREIVEVDIGVNKGTPVRSNTKINLETQGITGLVRLQLSTDNEDTAPPPRVEGHKYPVLAGTGSQLDKALNDLPAITGQIREIAEKVNGLLDEQTVAALKQSAVNTERLSRDLNGLLSPPNVANASVMLDNLSAASAQMPEIMERFRNTARQMDAAATSVNGILARNRGHIDRFASQGLSQLTGAAREAKSTAASVRGLTDKLKDDPSQLLYQPTSHGVEIPQ